MAGKKAWGGGGPPGGKPIPCP
eukprot:COSAG03_NODE_1024_length_5000_cov_3.947562_6_plen_21_part_01